MARRPQERIGAPCLESHASAALCCGYLRMMLGSFRFTQQRCPGVASPQAGIRGQYGCGSTEHQPSLPRMPGERAPVTSSTWVRAKAAFVLPIAGAHLLSRQVPNRPRYSVGVTPTRRRKLRRIVSSDPNPHRTAIRLMDDLPSKRR